MAQWAAFAGVTLVVLVFLLVLSHLTQSAVTDEPADPSPTADAFEGTPFEPTDTGVGPPAESTPESSEPATIEPQDEPSAAADRIEPGSLSTGMVLANVAVSQGLFALALVGAIVYTAIPPAALGLEFTWTYLQTGLFLGTAAGAVLYVGNEIAAALATQFGFDHDEQLRELLAPDSLGGWGILAVGVLPIIAVFEELLFRAALIGALSAGFAIDPWLLAVGSSIAFALGHGMQGTVGIVVTGLLGFVLAGLFIVTGSLLVVVVAHYWINLLEFVVHEGLGLDWTAILKR